MSSGYLDENAERRKNVWENVKAFVRMCKLNGKDGYRNCALGGILLGLVFSSFWIKFCYMYENDE